MIFHLTSNKESSMNEEGPITKLFWNVIAAPFLLLQRVFDKWYTHWKKGY